MSNQPNSYEPYGYDHYDQAPRSGAYARGLTDKIFGRSASAVMRNPLIATGALLLAGAAFAGILVASYPDSSDNSDIPVIKAETTAFKNVPDERGGMDVPHRDSTIFMSMDETGITERPPVENLLEQEDVIDKAEAFAGMPPAEITEAAPAAGAPAKTSTNEAAPPANESVASTATGKPKLEIQKIITEDETIPPAEIVANSADEPKPQKLHAPASSPETIAFVRSVLDKKDAARAEDPAPDVAQAQEANIAATSETPANIEPAAGAAIPAAGNFFIQVGSVKTRDGAASEWGKIQKANTGLQNLDYRVEEANLGDRGTFFRIQAGPVSKENANSICDSIKAQKPGGCLVVSK